MWCFNFSPNLGEIYNYLRISSIELFDIIEIRLRKPILFRHSILQILTQRFHNAFTPSLFNIHIYHISPKLPIVYQQLTIHLHSSLNLCTAKAMFQIRNLEGTKRSVYLRENPKMVEEPRIEIVR